ncbi:hypothetical protein J4468_01455 [Candidatus Woesearchaeota archaeon]|nr:hypothetical protein [Candidatus Woesearchaeota archaeon]
MTWYEQLKFSENPLDVRPNSNLIGLDEQYEKLINYIRKGEICFLNGLTGSGKTSMLKKAEFELKEHNFIYLNSEDLPRGFNLSQEIFKKRNFFDKLTFRKMPKKKPVLMIDEFQATDSNLILNAKIKWEGSQGKQIKSIVIAQISPHLQNVTGSFKDRIGNRIIKFKSLDEEDMRLIIKNRLYNEKTKINYADKIVDKGLDLIIKAAGGSPRRLLEYADMMFDFHFTKFAERNPILKQDYFITEAAVEEILAYNAVSIDGGGIIYTEEDTVDKLFNLDQQRMLRFLARGRTANQVASRFECSINKARRDLSKLKSKGAVIIESEKDKRQLWTLSNQARRLLVIE